MCDSEFVVCSFLATKEFAVRILALNFDIRAWYKKLQKSIDDVACTFALNLSPHRGSPFDSEADSR